jgi:hypothetical protein
MAVERNFGNLAEMYACSIAVADYGIRPVLIDSLMVSNVEAPGEGWPWVDLIPQERSCDPSVLTDASYNLPTFLHYCQAYTVKAFQHKGQPMADSPNYVYSKYQVPNEILDCPVGSVAAEGGASIPKKAGGGEIRGSMHLGPHGLLPDPPSAVNAGGDLKEQRNIFSNCVATRATNQAATDYRQWFCEKSINE